MTTRLLENTRVKALLCVMLVVSALCVSVPAARADGAEAYLLARSQTAGQWDIAYSYKVKVGIDLPLTWAMLESAGDVLNMAYQQGSINWLAYCFGLDEYDAGMSCGNQAYAYLDSAEDDIASGNAWLAQADKLAVEASKIQDWQERDDMYYVAIIALEYAVERYQSAAINVYCAHSSMIVLMNHRSAIFSVIP